MSEHPRDRPLAPADDEFERYLAEKLWAWIPEVYKSDDDRAAEAAGVEAGVLRTLVEVVAAEAATTRRSIDRLWEDAFIEVCDDWAVPLIGDLVATRLVHELNRRGRRVDVARTIYYRRRAGTPMVAEALIRDITGWHGALAEGFRRLTRAHHRLDPLPGPRRGPVTGTPPGGTALLSSVRGAALAGGPFDEFAYTPDVRQLRGVLGRVGIPKLNVHLYRHAAREVRAATPFAFGDGRFAIDPSGRDAPLYAPAQRPDPDDCRPAAEWELPAPIACRLLGAVSFEVTEALIRALVADGLGAAAADALAAYLGTRFESEARLRETLASLPEAGALLAVFRTIVAEAITADSPKLHLYPSAVQLAIDGAPVARERLAAANLDDWGASVAFDPALDVAVDPARGRVVVLAGDGDGALSVPVHHVGRAGAFGAGTYERRAELAEGAAPLPPAPVPGVGPIAIAVPNAGAHEIGDSRTYAAGGDVDGVETLALQATNGARPYVTRTSDAAAPAWTFTAALPASGEERRELMIDGLWIGILGEDDAPCPAGPAELVLAGDYDRVVLRHVTVDPGGERARLDPAACVGIPYVRLVVAGTVRELVIDASIVGPIVERAPDEDDDGDDGGHIEKLLVRDSVVHGGQPAGPGGDPEPAIDTVLGSVRTERATVLGDVTADRVDATDTLVRGTVEVTDNQHSCLRFSAALTAGSKPQTFQPVTLDGPIPEAWFVSLRFGDPGYAQLSRAAPSRLRRGASNRAEVGVTNRTLDPIMEDDLTAKLGEFLPIGIIPQLVYET